MLFPSGVTNGRVGGPINVAGEADMAITIITGEITAGNAT